MVRQAIIAAESGGFFVLSHARFRPLTYGEPVNFKQVLLYCGFEQGKAAVKASKAASVKLS
jgi:hypothetical protein